jgi:streptomycin adenylyltransferase
MDPLQFPAFAAWPEHRGLLARAVGHFLGDTRVPGLLLGGSFVCGTPDFYSDLDLYIVVGDEYFGDVLAEKNTAAAVTGQVLTGFVPDHLGPGGDEMYIAVYDGPVKVDFNYVRRSSVRPSWKMAARLILKDTDGMLAEVIRASAGLAPPPPSREMLEALQHKFWTWCWYVFGKIVRGELWEALDGVHTIRSLALVPMAEWDAGTPGEGHRRLETRLNDQVLACLAATIPTLDRVALHAALKAEMGLFRDLQARVWLHCGLPVDDTGGRYIEEAIERSWASLEAPEVIP